MYVSSGLHILNSCYMNYVVDKDIAINISSRICLKYSLQQVETLLNLTNMN